MGRLLRSLALDALSWPSSRLRPSSARSARRRQRLRLGADEPEALLLGAGPVAAGHGRLGRRTTSSTTAAISVPARSASRRSPPSTSSTGARSGPSGFTTNDSVDGKLVLEQDAPELPQLVLRERRRQPVGRRADAVLPERPRRLDELRRRAGRRVHHEPDASAEGRLDRPDAGAGRHRRRSASPRTSSTTRSRWRRSARRRTSSYDPNATYIVLTPPGTIATGQPVYCGYHTQTTSIDGLGNPYRIEYAFIPCQNDGLARRRHRRLRPAQRQRDEQRVRQRHLRRLQHRRRPRVRRGGHRPGQLLREPGRLERRAGQRERRQVRVDERRRTSRSAATSSRSSRCGATRRSTRAGTAAPSRASDRGRGEGAGPRRPPPEDTQTVHFDATIRLAPRGTSTKLEGETDADPHHRAHRGGRRGCCASLVPSRPRRRRRPSSSRRTRRPGRRTTPAAPAPSPGRRPAARPPGLGSARCSSRRPRARSTRPGSTPTRWPARRSPR